MYKTLFEHLKQTIPSHSDEGFNNLLKRMTLKEIKKKTIVQEEGKMTNEIFFVLKGSFQYYKNKEGGTLPVFQFSKEEHWTVDMESLTTNTPSKLNIQAMENCAVLKISKENFNHIYLNCADHKEFIRLKRIRHHNASSEMRYANMLERYPSIKIRVPSDSLASYLGITPEPFRRLRKNLQSKKHFLP
jgi:CRP-like cAMP-binding protein